MTLCCKICDYEAKNIRGLTTHISMAHVKLGHIQSQEDYYIKYLNGVINKCPVCGKNTPFARIDKGYSKFCDRTCSAHKARQPMHFCKICNEGFATIKTLEKHIITNHIQIEEYYQLYISNKNTCLECGKETKFCDLEYGYYMYCETCSSNYMICQICGKPHTSKRLFQFHIRSHVKTKEITDLETYYITFMGEKKKCKHCGKYCNFTGCLSNPYPTYCSSSCASKDTREDVKEIMSKHYQNGSIQEKIKETNMERYGVSNVFKSDVIKEKIKETNMERHGCENPNHNQNIRAKIKSTTLKNYGVDSPFKSDAIKTKIMETLMSRYGVKNISQHSQFVKKSLSTRSKNSRPKKYLKLVDMCNRRQITINFTKEDYLNIDNNTFEFECNLCHEKIIIQNVDCVMSPRCYSCWPKFRSAMEQEFGSWLNSIYSGIVINHDRTILKPKELDIFIPEKKLAIELNGDFWHTDQFMDSKYHINKTINCLNQGINLVHIFEREYLDSTEIVKSMVKTKLGLIDTKIYARDCEIKTISNQTSKQFIKENHIQGSSPNAYLSFGLYYKGELVFVLTYAQKGKRVIFGGKSNEQEIELLRLCSKINTIIIGGFSKLLKHSIPILKEQGITKIFTYANIRFSPNQNKTIYYKSGFKYVGKSEPGYGYIYDNRYYSRFAFTKQSLINLCSSKGVMVKDDDTEDTLSNRLGMAKLFDCGQHKFELDIQEK